MTFFRQIFLATLVLILSGCAAGPDFKAPEPETTEQWTSRHSGEASFTPPMAGSTLTPVWWQCFEDPVLNRLVDQALEASPDLGTAVLRFARSRTGQKITEAARMPEVTASGAVSRNRMSEHGSTTRLYDSLGGSLGMAKEKIIEIISDPYAWYQTGVDVSWEIDFWGRVSRSMEAAAADADEQEALLNLAKRTIAGDVVTAYVRLRSTQTQMDLVRKDLDAYETRLALERVLTEGGVSFHADLEQGRGKAEALRAGLPELNALETRYINQILLLLGEYPGALKKELAAGSSEFNFDKLPELALGLPSEVALKRPDIKAALAGLHQAVAHIGAARADLYPSIRLGGSLGLDTYRFEDLFDAGSQTWSLGPRLDIPLFDQGRRKHTVVLREQEAQEAAIAYHKTVLAAWHEIDDSLTRYEACRRKLQAQNLRMNHLQGAYHLIKARYEGGAVSRLPVLDARRSLLDACRSRAVARENLSAAFVAVNKAIGNGPD